MIGSMEDHGSLDSLLVDLIRTPTFNSGVVSEVSNGSKELSISVDNIVPDDILERIFTFFPIASMIRATAVCKRWYNIIYSSRFLWAHMLLQRPWYFMFTSNETAAGYAFDPILR
jgi:hypothetical protein